MTQTSITSRATETTRSSTPHSKNPYIQGARGLFCLMVFIYHVNNSGLGTLEVLRTPISKFLFGTLEFGVELFYGISGIVIIGSLQRSRSVRSFIWNRVTRIFPVLWATIAGVIIVAIVFKMPLPPGIEVLASMFPPLPLLGTGHVNPIAWTIDFEMAFYLLCSGVFYFGARSTLGYVFLAAAVAAMLFYPRTMMMLAGTLVALGWIRGPVVDRLVQYTLTILIVYLVSWRYVMEWVGGHASDLNGTQILSVGHGALLYPMMLASTAAGALALVGIVRGSGPLGRLLGSWAFVSLGNMSYSFYLWHIPIMAGVKRTLQWTGVDREVYAQALFFLLSFPIAVAVAWLSFRLIEIRLSNWLRAAVSSLPPVSWPKPVVRDE